MPLLLDTARDTDFFRWFCLEPFGEPMAAGAARLHCFRPTGPLVRERVELDLLVESSGVIVEASLGLDRLYVDDPRNNPFARDIAKSFLAWAVREPAPRLSDLIAGIADLSTARTPVFVRDLPPKPPVDATGGLAVFLGETRETGFEAGDVAVNFENRDGLLPYRFRAMPDPPASAEPAGGGRRWLRIDVLLTAGAVAADPRGVYYKIMRPPTQCVLWKRPGLVTTRHFFNGERVLVSESHLERGIFICRECGQRYFHEWYEHVDWDEGNDRMYTTYIPVETEDEIAALEKASIFDLMTYFPRLHADGGGIWRVLDGGLAQRDATAPSPKDRDPPPIDDEPAPVPAPPPVPPPPPAPASRWRLSRLKAAILVTGVSTMLLVALTLPIDAWRYRRPFTGPIAIGFCWLLAGVAAIALGRVVSRRIELAPEGVRPRNDARAAGVMAYGIVLVELALMFFAGPPRAPWSAARLLAVVVAWSLGTGLLRRSMR